MDAATWQMISIVGFAIAGLLFIALVFLFIKLKILSVIGDLTGRTASKQIQKIREQTADSGKKQKPSVFHFEQAVSTKPTGKSTRFHKSGDTEQATAYPSKQFIEEEKLNQPNANENLKTEVLKEDTAQLPYGNDTTVVLADDAELLESNAEIQQATEVLLDHLEPREPREPREDATEVLSDKNKTEVLTESLGNEPEEKEAIAFKVIKDVKVTHSDEVI